jgi:hypothetical protein
MQGAAKNAIMYSGDRVSQSNNYADQLINMEADIQTKNFSAALETCG